MKVAVLLPRGTSFGPAKATAIDLCARDLVLFSRFSQTTRIFARGVDRPFTDIDFCGIPQGVNIVSGMVEQIIAFQPDVIVVHQHLPSAMRIMTQLRRHGVAAPMILFKHAVHSPRSSFFKYIKRWKDARAFGKLAATVWVSDYAKKDFVEEHPQLENRCHTIWNALDMELWHPAAAKDKEVVFVGRAVPEKGIYESAQACAEVLSQHSEWSAFFAVSRLDNNDECCRRTREILSPLGERVQFAMDVPHDEVRKRLERASIVLAPSHLNESFGRTAVEAFASGAALISSNHGALDEVVDGAGIVLDKVTDSSVATALQSLIDQPAYLQSMAEKGRQRALESFDIRVSSKKLDDLFADVAGNHLLWA